MTPEKTSRDRAQQALLSLPPECCVVYADYFPLRKDFPKYPQLAESANGSTAITPCDSHEERLIRMMLELLHLSQSDKGKKETPLTIITNDDPNNLRRAAETLFKDSNVFQKILPRVTIIQQNALSHTDSRDRATSVRIVTLPPNTPKFPTHPIPNS